MDEYCTGCLVGGLVGDAAGATLEFMPAYTDSDIRSAMTMPEGGVHRVGPGQITDDGELTLALLHGLRGHHPAAGFPTKAVATQYCEWLRSRPFDVGNTCRSAFGGTGICKKVMFARTPEEEASAIRAAEQAGAQNEANGALMRCGPIAVWCRQAGPVGPTPAAFDVVAEHARNDARLSHPSKVCQDANAVYCAAILHLLSHPGDQAGAVQLIDSVASKLHPTVRSWIEDSKSADVASRKCNRNMGHVKHAFTLALHLLRSKPRPSYEQAIFTTLRLGGDSDTNACIVGFLMGALHGLSGIPEHMRRPVMEFNCASPTTGHKRPSTYKASHVLGPLPLA